MDIIQSWSVKVGVDVSKEKTQVILLIGNLSLSHAPNILIDRLIDRELKFIIWKESYIIPLHKSGNKN